MPCNMRRLVPTCCKYFARGCKGCFQNAASTMRDGMALLHKKGLVINQAISCYRPSSMLGLCWAIWNLLCCQRWAKFGGESFSPKSIPARTKMTPPNLSVYYVKFAYLRISHVGVMLGQELRVKNCRIFAPKNRSMLAYVGPKLNHWVAMLFLFWQQKTTLNKHVRGVLSPIVHLGLRKAL